MVNNPLTISPQKMARTTGFLYLMLVPLGLFGIMYVPDKLIIPADAVATANAVIANESLFRLSIMSALATQIVNLFVVLFLYKLLKPVNKNVALLMVIFLFLGIPIAMLNEINHVAVLLVLNGNGYLEIFGADQLYTQVMLFFDLHEYGITIASVFWGLWLLPMGYLVFKSGYLPRIIGILLIIGGFGYLVDVGIVLLFPGINMTVAQFTFIGEVLLPVWLLIKGVNVERWKRRAELT